MQPPAGEGGQAQVALDHNHFRLLRDSEQAQPRRRFAGVHDAIGGEARFFRVLDDHQPEGRGVAHGPAHGLGVGDGAFAVGKGDGAGFGQQPHLGQLLALQALGHGAVGIDLGQAQLARPPGDELDLRHIVDDQFRGRQADHRRHATRDGGFHRRRQVAELDPYVDQSRGQALAMAIDDPGAFGRFLFRHPVAEIGDGLAVGQ